MRLELMLTRRGRRFLRGKQGSVAAMDEVDLQFRVAIVIPVSCMEFSTDGLRLFHVGGC